MDIDIHVEGKGREKKEREVFRCSEEWLLMNKNLDHFHAVRRRIFRPLPTSAV